jgi:hypothetical protein
VSELTVEFDELALPAHRLSPLPSGYQPVAGRAMVARCGTLAITVLSGAWLAALIAQYQAIAKDIEVIAAGERVAVVLTAMRLVGAVTAFAVIVWLRRAYINLGPLGVRRLRFGSGWAVAGWFIPGLNAVRPKQIIDDIWRTTDPAAPFVIHEGWRGGRVPGWIHGWWALWVAAASLWLAGAFLDDPVPTRTSVALMLAVSVAVIVSGPLFWLLVGRLTLRQDDRARRVGADEWVRPTRSSLDRPLLALSVMATVAMIAFGVVTWPVVASETKVTPIGDPYAGYGVSFAYPFSFALTEAGLPDGAPDQSSGEVLAERWVRNDEFTVRWAPRPGLDDDATALAGALDTTVTEVVGIWGPTIFHGRPVEVTVDGQPAIMENFSVSSGTNMAYASVTVVNCAATERLLTIVVVADSARSIRRSLSDLVVRSAQC